MTIPAATRQRFERVVERYRAVHVVVSPPRCSSTAFSRVLWEQLEVGYYAHEPFEVTYYRDGDLDEVYDKISNPVDLRSITEVANGGRPLDLVIKEMPYQAGDNFPLLAGLASGPIVFLMRDPRLNIASRIEKKIEGGDSPEYPFAESGWELLARQIAYCRDAGIEHLLVDSTDFRNNPQEVFGLVLEALGLPFSPRSLEWRSCPELEIDNLGGDHTHLYRRVLASTGIEPATEELPDLDSFPRAGGWRSHVEECLGIYDELARLPQRVRPAPLAD